MVDKYKKNSIFAFLCGVIVGIIIFVLIYGVKVINPTNIQWLLHSNDLEGSIDLTQHYMGWVFYRDTPWRFPVGLTEGIYNNPVSVVYTDSIPLFALIFKIFSGILPVNFQYMGIFGLMSYALMGGFGALITKRFSSNVILNIISSIFFVMSPVMLNRMYLHTALSAHFLIVAGIVMWLYRDRMKHKNYVLLWTVLIVCATLINAYFTPILFGILLCSVLQDLILGERFKRCIGIVVVPIVATVFFAWIMGMFYGDTNASGSGGLNLLSFNLNGFINPGTYATAFGHFTHDFIQTTYSNIIKPMNLVTPYQNEGFSYLGLGMIILSFVSVVVLIVYIIKRVRFNHKVKLMQSEVINRKAGLGKYNKRRIVSLVISLSVYFVVFLLLALSPTWTIGGRVLLDIPLPSSIWNLLSTFRSTGRFIWPVYYMIMTLAIIIPTWIFVRDNKNTFCTRLFGMKRRPKVEKIVVIVIIGLSLLVQILDLNYAMNCKHKAFTQDTKYETDLKDSRWEKISEKCNKICIMSPTIDLYLDGLSAMTFEIFAKNNDMTMNMSYMSRDLTEYADDEIKNEFEKIKNGDRFDNHVYIFLSAKEDELPDPEVYHMKYYLIDGYIVGLDESVEI